jgi:hypothetical protein
MFSMNRAVATMSGIRRSFFIGIRGRNGEGAGEGLYHPVVIQAIAERHATSKSCVIRIGAACILVCGSEGPPFLAYRNM